jgi:hypothetical protein
MEQSYTQLPIPSRPPEDGASEGTSEWDCLICHCDERL